MATVNGVQFTPDGFATIGSYVESHGYRRNLIAVELNGEILPKAQYDSTIIADSDKIEIVSFVGGG